MKQFGGRRLKVSRVAAILLTHGHLDHTWGVLPWLQTMALDGRNEKITIIGPTSVDVIDALLGKDVEPLVPPSDLVIQYDMWMDLGANSESLGYELEWILGDGERWVNMNIGKQVDLLNQSREISAYDSAQRTIMRLENIIKAKARQIQ